MFIFTIHPTIHSKFITHSFHSYTISASLSFPLIFIILIIHSPHHYQKSPPLHPINASHPAPTHKHTHSPMLLDRDSNI